MADDNHKISSAISNRSDSAPPSNVDNNVEQVSDVTDREKEIGGRDGPDPTRYGDWEKNGRCIDF